VAFTLTESARNTRGWPARVSSPGSDRTCAARHAAVIQRARPILAITGAYGHLAAGVTSRLLQMSKYYSSRISADGSN